MRMVFLSFCVATLLNASCTNLLAPESEKGRNIASLGIDSNKYINMLPTQKLRDAAKEYAYMIGLERYEGSHAVGGANYGIKAFNWDLIQENECFRKLVSSFYSKVQKHTSFYAQHQPNYENYYNRNNLGETTEEAKEESGWLWKLALNEAGGDPNVAMTLLGICGHDNFSQLPIKEKVCKETEYFGTKINSCTIIQHTFPFISEKQKEEYQNYRPEMDGVGCPSQGSRFFTQGSLGKDTIIDSSLRRKIAEIQAPTMGIEVLPAKYYHTIAAAYATCSLVRGGVPNFMVRQIQSVGINTYRMIRLCDTTSNALNEIIGKSDMTIDSAYTAIRNFQKDNSICKPTDESASGWNITEPGCAIVVKLSKVINDPDVTTDIIKNKIKRVLGEADASTLFSNNVVSKDACKDVQLTKGNIDKVKEVAERSGSCPGISDDRCKAAREVLRTWWIDFEWSEAQHLKGANFAINNCKAEPSFLSSGLEKKSCEALSTNPIETESPLPVEVEQ